MLFSKLGGLETASIVGIVVGVIVLIVIAGIIAFFVMKKKSKSTANPPTQVNYNAPFLRGSKI